jgi:heme a synthase
VSVHGGSLAAARPAAPDADPARLLARRRRHLEVWFWSGAALTFLILVIGGVTRLTQSGLSIVDWQPIMGVVPPLREADWQAAFDRYRQFPEYQLLRRGMTMAEFQFIFFWEYLHRLAARLIGLVFLLPFVAFWARGYLDRTLLRRSLLLFALGAAQGFMGWFMVMSGLVDQPHVSHYRLAAHLSLAFSIFGLCVWYALDLRPKAAGPVADRAAARATLGLLWVFGVLFALQVVWGAFVAGLKAGLVYPTFPLMGGYLVPPAMLALEPTLRNLFENPVTVQWVHRVLATALAIAAVVLHLRAPVVRGDAPSRRLGAILVTLMAAQVGLGALTVVYAVPVALGAAHQAVALLIFGVYLAWLHRLQRRPLAAVEAAPLAAPLAAPVAAPETAPAFAPAPELPAVSAR